MGELDLSVPAHSPRDGSHGRASLAVQIGVCAGALATPAGRWPDGVYQLHHALSRLHADLLRLWAQLLCRAGVLSDLLRRAGHLDRAIDRQPALAAILPLRPARMDVAQSDVLEVAAVSTIWKLVASLTPETTPSEEMAPLRSRSFEENATATWPGVMTAPAVCPTQKYGCPAGSRPLTDGDTRHPSLGAYNPTLRPSPVKR